MSKREAASEWLRARPAATYRRSMRRMSWGGRMSGHSSQNDKHMLRKYGATPLTQMRTKQTCTHCAEGWLSSARMSVSSVTLIHAREASQTSLLGNPHSSTRTFHKLCKMSLRSATHRGVLSLAYPCQSRRGHSGGFVGAVGGSLEQHAGVPQREGARARPRLSLSLGWLRYYYCYYYYYYY